ncbi:hypothetical protein F5B20DRAFT_595127 [Whalleya microplaca]|nr:hypothetical protein F5B20DRAFT_595127 [Whalleya microplaca]
MEASTARPLRRILPTASTDVQVSPAGLTHKRATVSAACNNCRLKKTKEDLQCTAQRPKCAPCVARNVECVYDTDAAETRTQAVKRKCNLLQDQVDAYEEICQLLRVRSETEAKSILQKIREGADPQTILRHVHCGDVLLQLSLQPEARCRYEFPYITEMPSFLYQRQNPYLNTPIGKYESSPQLSHTGSDQSSLYNAPSLEPYRAATIVDLRLDTIKPSKWTSVCADDALMRKMLHDYFLFEYQWFPFFQKDYLLDDMLSGRRRFCSPLLINAILAHASHGDARNPSRAEFWNPQNIGYKFFSEARRLWELETGQAKLTTVQSGMLLNVVWNLCAADQTGWQYMVQSVALAHDLKLFDAPLEKKGGKMQDARDFTAWALFTIQSRTCWYYLTPPLIDQPPSTPLPDPAKDSTWYGEFWLKNTPEQNMWPAHFGIQFHASAQLNTLLNDFERCFFGCVKDLDHVSRNQILELYRKATTWYDHLPDQIVPRPIMLPSHFKLHMHYFNVLVYVLGVTACAQGMLIHPSEFSPTEKRTTEEILWDAQLSLETVIRLYYLRYGFDAFDSWVVQPVSSLAFIRQKYLNENRESPIRDAILSTVILCGKGLRDQGQNFHLAEIVFRLLRDGMLAEDARVLTSYVKSDVPGASQRKQSGPVRSFWPVKVASVTDDPRLLRLSRFMDQLQDSTIDSDTDSDMELSRTLSQSPPLF